jgi:hypothetical protein
MTPITLLTRAVAVLTKRQRDQEFRLSVAETATLNITMRLEYFEAENERLTAIIAELLPMAEGADIYATPAQKWALQAARELVE